MRNLKMGIRRLGASFAALLMVCCLTVPALAAVGAPDDFPLTPDGNEFDKHPFSWYVCRDLFGRFELTAFPFIIDSSSGYPRLGIRYSYDPTAYTYSVDSTHYYKYLFPPLSEPSGRSGSWRYYPSFPVGDSAEFAHVIIYPALPPWGGSFDLDLLSSNKYAGGICPSPSYFGATSSFNYAYDSDSFITYPMSDDSQQLFPVAIDSWKNGNSYGNQTYAFQGLNDDFAFLKGSVYSKSYLQFAKTPAFLSSTIWGNSTSNWPHFPSSYTCPSSEVRFWFCRTDNPNLSLPGLTFIPTLSIPKSFLPDDTAVGDWISNATLEDLQDELVHDFDVNSDTLKNSKQNFDSWQNSNTIDTDVADTGLNIINALMQNVGQFAFIVSLLCFGAVVLRVLIRKAVEG